MAAGRQRPGMALAAGGIVRPEHPSTSTSLSKLSHTLEFLAAQIAPGHHFVTPSMEMSGRRQPTGTRRYLLNQLPPYGRKQVVLEPPPQTLLRSFDGLFKTPREARQKMSPQSESCSRLSGAQRRGTLHCRTEQSPLLLQQLPQGTGRG